MYERRGYHRDSCAMWAKEDFLEVRLEVPDTLPALAAPALYMHANTYIYIMIITGEWVRKIFVRKEKKYIRKGDVQNLWLQMAVPHNFISALRTEYGNY